MKMPRKTKTFSSGHPYRHAKGKSSAIGLMRSSPCLRFKGTGQPIDLNTIKFWRQNLRLWLVVLLRQNVFKDVLL